MYLVVSRWEPMPGHENDFDPAGLRVGSVLRKQPGVVFLEVFPSGSQRVAVHGYRDEATYRAIVHDPNGAFARAQAEYRVEEVARFIGSESGETLPLP